MLANVHLALVHEVEQGTHFTDLDVAQVDDRMRVFVFEEDLFKVRTARGQYRLMCFDNSIIAGKRDITQFLILQQGSEYGCQVGLMVVPA